MSLALLFPVAALLACDDALLADCDDCPIPDLAPACLEAAADCDQFSGDTQTECLAEARALCTTEPTPAGG